MSIAPESLASERFRELRKVDEKIQKLWKDLAEAREAVGILENERAAAAQRDKRAYATALSEGEGRPAKREEGKVAAELEESELRAEALKLAIDSMLDERSKLLEQNHPIWRLKAMRTLAAARTRYMDAIVELDAARDSLSDEAALVGWLDGGAGITAAVDSLGGRVGNDANGRPPLSFAAVLDELRRDAEHLVAHPVIRDDPVGEPRFELARGGGSKRVGSWGG
jgi:chromosome segregation ATPase